MSTYNGSARQDPAALSIETTGSFSHLGLGVANIVTFIKDDTLVKETQLTCHGVCKDKCN